MRSPFGKQFYKLAVVAWLTFSLGSVVLALTSWQQLTARLNDGKKVTLARNELKEVYNSLLGIETGERGYIITGDTNFLEPFIAGQTNMPQHRAALTLLLHDDAALTERIAKLSASAEASTSWQREVVGVREQNFTQAVAMVSSGKLKRMMDDIREQVGGLDDILNHRQMQIHQEVFSRVFHSNLGTLVSGIFGIGSGLLALWLSYVAVRHKQHEFTLNQARLQAEHSNLEKTAFLANMSHEIRTPMNAILGFSELLQDDLREPKHRQYIHSIRTSAGSLLTLINDILDMSKIEAGLVELRPEPTDLREICDFLQTLFSQTAVKKNLKLECHVAGKLPHALLMDRIRLRQILVNLIGNAIKFTDQGGVQVRVALEKEDSNSCVTLIIEIQDTGVGIPKEKLDAIFKPFVQAGAHRDKEKQGTGLGLSIVKRLTEIMGGTVTVASVLGEGSAFQLRFPNVPISMRLPASSKKTASEQVDFNQLRPAMLLVVDDNQTNCHLIEGIFAGTHHRLVFGSSGAEAVSKARELKPDILLLDVRMPGMNGYEAMDAIRKIPSLEFLPIIAVTASTLESEEKLLSERFSGFVRKPFSKRELFEELSDFLPRQSKPETSGQTGPANDSNTAPPMDSQPVPNAPKELISELRRRLIDRWPALCESMAVNESKMFGVDLADLGRRWDCEPLVHYAQKLIFDAENYAVTDLEKHLGEFGLLVEQLEGGWQK